eukprot:m.7485 g.7485  ORF g.7485 m.7485 type:complete len:166 (+) comp18785_c0_seq1:55-552(+)
MDRRTKPALDCTQASSDVDLSTSYQYVKEVDEYFRCSICLTAMVQPVVAPCGHSFCRKCIESWLTKENVPRSCPQCRTRVRKDQLQTVVALGKAIDALEVYCPFRSKGCEKIVKREALKEHASNCSFDKVPCPTCGSLTERCGGVPLQRNVRATGCQSGCQSIHN